MLWLKSNKLPPDQPKTFCWWYCRCGNILYKNFIPKAFLDWEIAFLGNPITDLVWGIVIDDTNSLVLNALRLEGYPNQDGTIKRWILNTGFNSDYYSYYGVLALLKFLIIMVMTSRRMMAKGFLPSDTDYYVNNHVIEYLNSEIEKI